MAKKSYGNHANPRLAIFVRALSGGFELCDKSCSDNEDMFVVLDATYHDLYDRPEYVPLAIVRLGDCFLIKNMKSFVRRLFVRRYFLKLFEKSFTKNFLMFSVQTI